MKTGTTLITGVGRRAGLHLALHLQEQGHKVIGTYRTERAVLDDLVRRGVELHRCDFHDQSDVDCLIDTLRGQHESLRGIIHNASQWMEDSEGSVCEVLGAMMRVHVAVPLQLNRALMPLLMKHAGTHADIIHVGDYVSTRGSVKHMAYAASKAAQDNLTLSFARKLAPKIKVNTIAPALLAFNEGDDEEYKSKALTKSLMQREAGFSELARMVDFLFDSAFVTGRVLHLDGGRHLR